ncbi:MAG: hypothetical protein WC679_13475 [Bacteroidales bacterium]|jgi:hypothetical protein
MKRVIVVLIVFLFVTQIPAQTLEGFWSIPWKSSISETKMMMEGKGQFTNSTITNALSYPNIVFAERTGKLSLFFDSDRFYCSNFTIIPIKNNALKEYTNLKNDLIKKYNKPSKDKEEYLYPYEKGDGHEETAISGNYTKIDSSWWFDDSNAIILSLSSEDYKISITLSYYCGEIMKERMQNKSESINKDL